MQAALKLADIIEMLLARYLVAAGCVSLLLLGWSRFSIWKRRIRQVLPHGKQIRREIVNSVISVIVLSLTSVIVYGTAAALGIRPYNPFEVHATIAFNVIAFIAIILAHDAYFYWTHRAMHLPRFYAIFHQEHHRSHGPSPWAAYSFAVPEATVQGAFFPIYLMIVPTPLPALICFGVVQIALNAIGHSGLELMPRVLVLDLPIMNGVTHHDMHHAKFNCNYGLYFRIWDRLMKTEHPAFPAAYRYVISEENKGDLYTRRDSVLRNRRQSTARRPQAAQTSDGND